jgi:short-subunit dehydrogenase involved in D-alanine esterification of teichoic acids
MLAKRLDVMRFRVFAGCYTNNAVTELTEECSENLTAIQVDVSSSRSIDKMVETIKNKLPTDKGKFKF